MEYLFVFKNGFLLNVLCIFIVVAQNPLSNVEDSVYDAFKWVIEGTAELTRHPVNKTDVTFTLHTSEDHNSTNNFINLDEPMEFLNATGNIYFFTHGWTQSRQSTPWYTPLTEILLERSSDDYIIQTDWSTTAGQRYPFAAFAVETIGDIVGDFLFKIVKNYGIPVENIILIGHSLGAHVSSWACKRFYELSGSKIHRLIALDPAGPLFILRPEEKKLNANDAKCVVVVHSDKTFFGYPTDIGTLDFYPNEGKNQPGCNLDWRNLTSVTDDLFCSHRRGYEFFVAAVQNPQYFMAKRCPTYEDFNKNRCDNIEASLGDLETTETGDFFLNTSATFPYFSTDEQRTERTASRERKSYQLQN